MSRIDEDFFTDKDFEGMMFPVNLISDRSVIVKQFPVLETWEEWKGSLGKINKTLVGKYIVYVYDRDSPFRKTYPNAVERKYRAGMLAGFPKNDEDEFRTEYQSLIMGKNFNVNRMVVRFVREHNSILYTYIVSQEHLYYQELNNILSGQEPNPKMNMKTMRQDLEVSIREMLAEDIKGKVELEFYKFVAQEAVELRPEHVAAMSEEEFMDGHSPYVDQ